MAPQKLTSPSPHPKSCGVSVGLRAVLMVWWRQVSGHEEQASEIKAQLSLTSSLGSATSLLGDLGKPLPLSGFSF